MTDKNRHSLSSREVLKRIGLGDDLAKPLLLDLDDTYNSPEEDLAQGLQERFASLTNDHAFAPGDLVHWKAGMKNRRLPKYGMPAVVVEVLDTPVFDTEKDAGSGYFREPLNVVLGVFLDKGPHRGDFMTWHFDARRFRRWMAKGV